MSENFVPPSSPPMPQRTRQSSSHGLQIAPQAPDFFEDYEDTQAYLKAGIMGQAGSGKTKTGSIIAAGLIKTLRERGIKEGNRPVAMLETETGADFVKKNTFDPAGIKLKVKKTRAFVDLIPSIHWACEFSGVLLIDSITHFWMEFCATYAAKKGRKRGLEFSDWNFLKTEWWRMMDVFKDSPCHILLLGRAGFEYDMHTNEAGKKELEKVGVKMKAEGETAFEPSLLVLMETKQSEQRNPDTNEMQNVMYRVATVFKDRSEKIDGMQFINPTYENFRPAVEFLNLGGKQIAVGEGTSEGIIEDDYTPGRLAWQEKEILLDEIQQLIVAHYPGQSAEDKKTKIALLEKHFGSHSWERVKTFKLDALRNSYDALHLELRGKWAYPGRHPQGNPASAPAPAASDDIGAGIDDVSTQNTAPAPANFPGGTLAGTNLPVCNPENQQHVEQSNATQNAQNGRAKASGRPRPTSAPTKTPAAPPTAPEPEPAHTEPEPPKACKDLPPETFLGWTAYTTALAYAAKYHHATITPQIILVGLEKAKARARLTNRQNHQLPPAFLKKVYAAVASNLFDFENGEVMEEPEPAETT